MKTFNFLFFAFIVFSSSAFSQDTEFHRIHLKYDISLDVPSHWMIISQDNRKNIRAAGKAMTDNAGIESSAGQKETLLAINSTPSPAGAMIRVSVTSPPDYKQSDLTAATPEALKAIGTGMHSAFSKLEASGGPKIIEMQPVRIEKFKTYRVLVMPYIRAGITGPSPWQVTQYKIPLPNRLIEITLSHRQSDAVVWRPILERVWRSVQF